MYVRLFTYKSKMDIESINNMNNEMHDMTNEYEFCTRCQAILGYQRGYSNKLHYWKCRGCGEILINPNVPDGSGIAWICDECEELLNVQSGFSENVGEWKCTECGHTNRISANEVYIFDDEYRIDMNNPYRGMAECDVLELMGYEEIEQIGEHEDIFVVRSIEDKKRYVKKILSTFDLSIYRFLYNHPIDNMPRIYKLYEGDKYLIVIEEYIEGCTIADLLKEGIIETHKAIEIIRGIANVLIKLHGLEKPIVHRDIKPSNVMLGQDGQVYLLDVNVAKWYEPDKNEDTRLLGTINYAAPEQLGFGFSSSSTKADIYSLGMLFNIMITRKYPKEKKIEGNIGLIIEKCISLEPDNRYSAIELLEVLRSY